MSTAATVLSIIGALVALTVLGAGVYVIFTTSAKDAREKRLRDENVDLIRRLDYVEPKLKTAEEQNALLMQLHNPTAQLEQMSAENRQRHVEISRLLKEQSQTLHDIDDKVTRSTP